MLFVVQGVVSIKKSVLFIQVVGSAQPSLVGHGPVSAVRIRPTIPALTKNVGETTHVDSANLKFHSIQLATLAESKYRN
jgi:hypothetical protein